ncbi:MAG: AMP-binding protein [Clostridia bacterium]|nr:AMP-binding protein [Clostridia bacterium]
MKNPPLNNAPSFVNMRELVEYIDQKYATGIAYSFRKNPHDNEIQTRSYARLCEDVRCIAAAAAERGIPQAGHCALIGKLSYGWVCTYLALLSVGAVLVPLDPDWSAEDLTDTVGKAECTSLFCSDDVFAHKASAITEATGIKTIVTIDYAESDCTLEDLVAEGKQLRENGSAAYESARIHPDELALLVFTSGTTGKGKGVMLSQTAILSNITAGLQLITLNTDKTIGLLPPHHTFGSTINILGNLLYGVNMYISSGARYVAAELKEQKPGHIVLVPLYLETLYRKIKAAIKDSGKEKAFDALTQVSGALNKVGIDVRKNVFKGPRAAFGGALELVVSGGAPLSPEIADAFEALGIRVLNGYGITECAPLLAVNRNKLSKRGSIGQPIPNGRIKIKDPNENGEGEICAKGPNVMLGYYKDPEATAATFDEDGYFRTGDIGKTDEEGWLYITGRSKNLIILSNGKNVYPEEIETALAAVPGVQDVVVYEGISKRGGEHNAIVAEIYPDPEFIKKNNITDKAAYFRPFITDFNRTAVAYKKISVLKVRETEFPKNTLRKITRFNIDKTID